MATPEDLKSIADLVESAKIAAAAIEKFGDKTGAVSKAIESMTRITKSGVDAQEALNREKIVEKKLAKDAANSIKDLYQEVKAGSKTQKEANEELEAMRQTVRENNDLSIKQKDSLLGSIDTARAKAQTDLHSQKVTESFSDSVAKASAVLGPLGTAVSNVIRGLQSGRSDPFGSAVEVMKAEASVIASAAQGLGGVISNVAPAFAKIPGLGGKLQMGAAGMGTALSAGGTALNKLGAFIDPVVKATSEMIDAFKTTSSAGAMFGGGMSELRTIAGQAGIDMRDLAEGVSANSDAFIRSGVSATQAARMIGNFGRGLSHGTEAAELMALGVTEVKDRVALAASAFEQARMTGTSLADAQKNITSLTVQYTKDFKLLQAIVGKDAERALERGRAAAAATAVQSKLNEDQKKSYDGVVRTFEKFGPEADRFRLALAQLAQGGVITDAVIRNDPAIMAFLEQTKALALSGKTANETVADTGKAMSDLQKIVQSEASSPTSARSILAQATVQLSDRAGDLLRGITSISDVMILPKTAREEIDKTVENQKKLTGSTEKMTESVLAVIQNQQNLSAALQNVATSLPIVTTLTGLLQAAQQPIQTMIDKLKEFTQALERGTTAVSQQGVVGALGGGKGIGEVAGRGSGAVIGSTIGGTIGSALGPAGTVAGAAIGAYLVDYFAGESFKQVGGAIGNAIGVAIDNGVKPAAPLFPMSEMNAFMPQMAKGGIISGPTSGYPATLHGREMVIPLPDNATPEVVSKAIGRGTEKPDENSDRMVDLMKTLNENFQNMQTVMRSIADHTERTARGVS